MPLILNTPIVVASVTTYIVSNVVIDTLNKYALIQYQGLNSNGSVVDSTQSLRYDCERYNYFLTNFNSWVWLYTELSTSLGVDSSTITPYADDQFYYPTTSVAPLNN